MRFTSVKSGTCPEIGVRVALNQSEAECRSQHGCEQRHCPLGREFSPESVDFLIEAARVLDR